MPDRLVDRLIDLASGADFRLERPHVVDSRLVLVLDVFGGLLEGDDLFLPLPRSASRFSVGRFRSTIFSSRSMLCAEGVGVCWMPAKGRTW